jgi:hypothetical protein
MGKRSDTSKEKNAVAIAVGDRTGEVRYLGEIGNTPEATRKLVTKLAAKYHPRPPTRLAASASR